MIFSKDAPQAEGWYWYCASKTVKPVPCHLKKSWPMGLRTGSKLATEMLGTWGDRIEIPTVEAAMSGKGEG